MKLLERLFNISVQYSGKRTRYARAGTAGKILRLVWALVCVALAIACAYGAKHFLSLADTVGTWLAGIFFLVLAVGFFLSMFSNSVQYAIIGFTADKASKKTNVLFGFINILYIFILIAGDAIVILA